MLIDSHCHLNFKAFKKDVDEVVGRAKRAGVEKMIVIGADLKSSQKAVELAQKYKGLFASVGIHPHHVKALDNKDLGKTKTRPQELHSACHPEFISGSDKIPKQVRNDIENIKFELINLTKNKKVVAIGETGLDYHIYKNSKYGQIKLTEKIRDLQKKIFKLHLELAEQLNLPLIIHCRQAFDDLLDILALKADVLKRKGVLHCFEGNRDHLCQVLDWEFFVGFDGNITYPKNDQLRDLITETPIERLLLETDSPFLTPQPLRGARNEPKNLKFIAQEIAHLKKISLKEVALETTANADSLFRLS